MRILHVVPSYLPAVRYGGPIVSVHGLCKALVRHGHDVHVFTTNVDGPNDSAVPLSVPVEFDGVKVRYFPVPAMRRLYWSPRLGTALQEELKAFDVLHTHSVFLWPTWAAARTAKLSRIPYVLSPRGMLVKDLVKRKSPLAKKAWIKLIESRNIQQSAAIHVTSRVEAEDLVQFGFKLPRIHIVPNGVDLPATCDNDDATSPAIMDLVSGVRYLLFLGRINWKKGLDRLIEALPRISTVRLVVAGNDEENYRPKLEALAARHRVTDRVIFAGPAYGEDKQALLRHAAALVVPSYSENFGNVVLEAMAAGCPVVTTPEVGAAEIVRESEAGLVVGGSPDALATGISALLADSGLMGAMGKRGRDCVNRRYTWDAVARTMESTYRNILTGKIK